MPVTKPIHLTNQQKLELFNATRGIRATSMADIRANNRFFREFGLEAVEAAILSLGNSQPQNEAEVRAHNAAFLLRFNIEDPTPVEYQISEAAAVIFRGYMDRLAEIFPAGKSPDGNDVPAGMPSVLVRKLAPIVEAIDEAWPVAEGKAA